MSTHAYDERQPSLVPVVFLLGVLAVFSVGVVAGLDPRPLAPAVIVTSIVTAWHRTIFRWHVLLAAILWVILFVPIKRYELPGNLPFDLEPYRIAVAIVIFLWLGSLLVDRRVRLRRTPLDAPLMLFALAAGTSVVLNAGEIDRVGVGEEVVKRMLFFASFYLVFYFVVSVIRDFRAIHIALKTLVGGTSVIAAFALVEARSGFNVFDNLHSIAPFMHFTGALDTEGIARSGRLRVYGSAQHPIALAALFVMMLPLAVYLARQSRQLRWWVSSIVIALGVFATVSRTGVIMLAAIAIVFYWLRRDFVKKLWPLALPGLLAVHFALPGAIGGLQGAFFPPGGIVKDQTVYGGRVSPARLGPQLELIKDEPLFGIGFGSRVFYGPIRNARILDDEWLGTTVETGLVGAFAWIWIFGRFVRRLAREAKRDDSSRGWLLTALTASAVAFALSMFTYDAFFFIQGTFVLFILAALGMCVLASGDDWPPEMSRSRRLTTRFRSPARQVA